MNKIIPLFILIILNSCSSFFLPRFRKVEQIPMGDYQLYDQKDYLNQLSSLKDNLFVTKNLRQIAILGPQKQYLDSLVRDLDSHNETFLTRQVQAEYYIIDTPTPFHFSLPPRVIYFSSGLISKYIKHESVLVSIMAYELIRCEKNIFNKISFIPKGFTKLEQLLQINRIDTDTKIELHKWSFHITRRSGYDSGNYLGWIQMQNRNLSDFQELLGFTSGIAREEAYFKSFLVRQSKSMDDEVFVRKESSKKFYKFLYYIKDAKRV